MPFPKMIRVHQSVEAPRIDDIAGEVEAELAKLNLGEKIKPGETVAISAGSRGIANIAKITKAAVDHFKSLGAVPFIVPSMGSHGGGTAEGQREILEGYGITESYDIVDKHFGGTATIEVLLERFPHDHDAAQHALTTFERYTSKERDLRRSRGQLAPSPTTQDGEAAPRLHETPSRRVRARATGP